MNLIRIEFLCLVKAQIIYVLLDLLWVYLCGYSLLLLHIIMRRLRFCFWVGACLTNGLQKMSGRKFIVKNSDI